jgi:hypothetical protein
VELAELIASEVFGCRMFSRANMNDIILDTGVPGYRDDLG